MLENILSEINESLKVIANSVKEKQEIKVLGAMPNVMPTTALQPAPMPNTPIPTTPQAVQSVSNTPQPIPTAPVQQVPVQPATERNFTQEELARAMSDAVSAGKMNTVMSILGQFNVQVLSQVDPKDYNKLAAMLIEAGVKI